MSSLSKIAGAKMTGGGSNIRDGKYTCLVESAKLQQGHNGECFIAELRVIEAQANGEMAIDTTGKGTTDKPVVPNPAGTNMSLVCNLTKHGDTAASNVKKFVFGVLSGLGYTEEQITEEVLGQVISGAQPLRGMSVVVETYRDVNKGRLTAANAGNILVKQNWKGIPQDGAVIKAQRTYLDTNKAQSEKPAAPPVAAAPGMSDPATSPAAPAGGGLMGLMK